MDESKKSCKLQDQDPGSEVVCNLPMAGVDRCLSLTDDFIETLKIRMITADPKDSEKYKEIIIVSEKVRSCRYLNIDKTDKIIHGDDIVDRYTCTKPLNQ